MASSTATLFVLSLFCLQMATVRTDDDDKQQTDALRPDEDLRIMVRLVLSLMSQSQGEVGIFL